MCRSSSKFQLKPACSPYRFVCLSGYACISISFLRVAESEMGGEVRCFGLLC